MEIPDRFVDLYATSYCGELIEGPLFGLVDSDRARKNLGDLPILHAVCIYIDNPTAKILAEQQVFTVAQFLGLSEARLSELDGIGRRRCAALMDLQAHVRDVVNAVSAATSAPQTSKQLRPTLH